MFEVRIQSGGGPVFRQFGVLGGSWVVISMGISPLTWLIIIVTLLTTPFITTHEPPSVGVSRHGYSSQYSG